MKFRKPVIKEKKKCVLLCGEYLKGFKIIGAYLIMNHESHEFSLMRIKLIRGDSCKFVVEIVSPWKYEKPGMNHEKDLDMLLKKKKKLHSFVVNV